MSALRLADDAARQAATADLSSNIMLDASAGTGKTTVLIRRILRLLEAGTPIERIVAITFTEKAAGELLMRLRDAIEECLAAAEDEASAEPWHAALRNIDRANVSTIHAFCARLLRERPVEARVEPRFAVFDELASFLLQHEVWSEWLEEALEREDPALASLIDLDIERRSLRTAAFRLLDHRDLLDLLPLPCAASVEDLTETLGREASWLAAQKGRCEEPSDGALSSIDDLQRQLETLSRLRGEERHRFLLFEMKVTTHRGSKGNWPGNLLSEVKQRLRNLKDALEETAVSLGHNVVVEVYRWLSGYVQRYRQELAARGGIDFTDLLIRARDLLRDRVDVRGDFQRRFSHLLVDEFQDTDPLQAEIVFFLAERRPRAERWDEVELEPGKLLVVGDPKQSIYRFRRADVEMYDAAKRAVAAQGRALELSTNFRSSRPLVSWVNQVFAALIRAPEDGAYQPAYEPIVPQPEAPSAGRVLAVPVADAADRKALLATEARTMAALIERAVAEEWPVERARAAATPLRYRDIAVLFRANEPMGTYEEALREYGIPCRVAGGQQFYQRSEIVALLALARALANPGDEIAAVATLRGPFFGFSDEDLFLYRAAGGSFRYVNSVAPELPHADLFQLAFDRLLRFHRRALEVPPSALLSELFAEARLLPLLALQEQGDQRVANLWKVIDFARSLGAERTLTFRSFVRLLETMAGLGADESDSPVAEESDDVVRLLTIHKAKGLEFPFVVIAHGGQGIDARAEPPIFDRAAGQLGLSIAQLRSIGWKDLAAREKARVEAEAYRLLYVAATRARDVLVLPQWPEEQRGAFIRAILEAGEATVLAEPLDAAPRLRRPFRVEGFPPPPGVDSGAPGITEVRRWEAQRASMLAREERKRVAVSATSIKSATQEQLFLFEGVRRGPKLGTAVHQILRRVQSAGEVAAAAPGVCASLNLATDDVAEVVELCRRAFDLPHAAMAARAKAVFREVPFVWCDGDQLVEGQIDLAFRRRDGLVVVDYKTDNVRRERDLERRALAYRPQIVTYARALECITREPVVDVILAFLRPGVERHVRLDWAAEWQHLRQRL